MNESDLNYNRYAWSLLKDEEFSKKSKQMLDSVKNIMSGRLVYMNGEFVPEEDARISIYDSALMFGDMVFEMTRSFNKLAVQVEGTFGASVLRTQKF